MFCVKREYFTHAHLNSMSMFCIIKWLLSYENDKEHQRKDNFYHSELTVVNISQVSHMVSIYCVTVSCCPSSMSLNLPCLLLCEAICSKDKGTPETFAVAPTVVMETQQVPHMPYTDTRKYDVLAPQQIKVLTNQIKDCKG